MYNSKHASLLLILEETNFTPDLQLANTVLQGTVLGPSLWNVFFSDVIHCVSTKEAALSVGDL